MIRKALMVLALALLTVTLAFVLGTTAEEKAGAVPAEAAGPASDALGAFSEDALAWPIKASYSGHGCTYYERNGNRYAMCWVHTHSVPVSTCTGTHMHHVAGYIKVPGGYYSRINSHDHHYCASPAPHFG